MGSLGSGAPDVFVTISDWSNFTRQALKGYLLLEGKCERGPIGTAVLCSDFTDFRMTYGWLIDGSDFAYLVKRAMSYGARVVVNRIAHYEDPADPTTLTATRGEATLVDRADPAKSTLGITAINEGAWSRKIKWTVTDGTINPSTEFNLIIEIEDDLFVEREFYPNHTMETILDAVNGVSKIVTIADLDSDTEAPRNRPANGTGNLAEGDDGLTGLNAADYIGDESVGTGLYAFDEISYGRMLGVPECVDLDGTGPETVQAAVQTYCNTHRRQMMFALHSSLMALTPQDAADYRNGTGKWEYAPINDWCGAMFYGDLKVLDPRTGNKLTYINPIGDVGGAIAKGNSENRAYTPVAGSKYGILSDVSGVRYNVGPIGKRGHADILAEAQINPVVVTSRGCYIEGINTLQRESTQLQNIPTAWLLMAMKETLYEMLPSFQYMPINPRTCRLMASELDPWLAGLVAEEGLYAYDLQCDQNATSIANMTVNKLETIRQGILKGRVLIQPTVYAKWIGFTIGVGSPGVTLDYFETETL